MITQPETCPAARVFPRQLVYSDRSAQNAARRSLSGSSSRCTLSRAQYIREMLKIQGRNASHPGFFHEAECRRQGTVLCFQNPHRPLRQTPVSQNKLILPESPPAVRSINDSSDSAPPAVLCKCQALIFVCENGGCTVAGSQRGVANSLFSQLSTISKPYPVRQLQCRMKYS